MSDLITDAAENLSEKSIAEKDRLITEAVKFINCDKPWTPCSMKGRMERFIMPNGDEKVYIDGKLMLTFKPPSFSMVLADDGLNYQCVCNQPYIEHWREADNE